jgi:DNA processing protein
MTALSQPPSMSTPFDELVAFESLATLPSMTRTKLSALLAGRTPARALGDRAEDEAALRRIRSLVAQRLGTFLACWDGAPGFPSRLLLAPDALPFTYYRGNLAAFDLPAVSLVGSRSAYAAGCADARALGMALADAGVCLVMGMAAGIDTAALNGALKEHGEVIGVLGTPIDRYRPKENRELQDEVGNQHLLVSQVPLLGFDGTQGDVHQAFFHERDVTMAALADTTVIIEAHEQSATRTQAEAGLAMGHEVILMARVCDEVSWAQGLLDQGAVRTDSIDEVISILGL